MRHLIALTLLAIAGCGSSAPKAEEPKPAESGSTPSAEGETAAAEAPEAEEEKNEIPTACAGDADACIMPKGFVRRLCAKAYPELALMFFQQGSPWRRAYVSVRELAPFNGLDGVSSDEKLTFEEELLILGEKKVDMGGMQVSGAGSSYHVLRWDGTCATLSAEEVRLAAPPKPKHAAIPWRILEDATQEALLQDENVAKVVAERKKECKGVTIGAVTDKCEKADRRLNDIVFAAVRGGTKVPQPAKVP